MALEVERKFLDVDLDDLRNRLREQGARCLGAHFEANTVFDTPEGDLFSSGRLLRLRSQEWQGKTCHLLTLKLPVEKSGGFKVRKERETEVADGEALRGVLEGLGYSVTARYEKIREPWRMDNVEVELDALPFGEVVELEGRAQDIERVEKRLSLDTAEISTKTYHDLHQEWLRQNNKPRQLSFVFDTAQRAHWRTVLGLTEKADSTLV